jgi:uncharacterized membrane protein
MWVLVGLFVGAFVGNLIWPQWGAALGGLLGFVIGARLVATRTSATKPSVVAGPTDAPRPVTPNPKPTDETALETDRVLQDRLRDLERRVGYLEYALVARGAGAATEGVESAKVAGPAAPEASFEETGASSAAPIEREEKPEPEVALAYEARSAEATQHEIDSGGTSSERMRADDATVVAPNPLWTWLISGNALTRIGVVVLFFGVAFLLKYFAEHFTLSIEVRLAAVAAAGAGLIVLGIFLSAKRPGYGLSLQGAGAGVIYLTTYAAFSSYGVLSAPVTLALLVAVSGLTVWLALRNDSQPFAALAIAGAFLAPLLVESDSGPALLFGYFALLNVAILALAWRKAWRALNAVGFVFTFVLGAYWGYDAYRPEHFAIVEPFLILFFAFYIAIPILYAQRGASTTKNPVDGLLVFGVPLVGFVLQAALVSDTRYGAAWSALVVALVYAGLFGLIRRRAEPQFSLLARAFLILAAIFATIAIPLALDHRTTASLWAAEAAGVYWIGVRQNTRLARLLALVIEIGAGIMFVASSRVSDDATIFLNAFFVGALLIGISGVVTAYLADRASYVLSQGERSLVPLIFAWGIAWSLGAGGFELARHLSAAAWAHGVLAWVAASALLSVLLQRWLEWPRIAQAAIVLLPTMLVVAALDFDSTRTTLTAYGWILWPTAWLVHWFALHAYDAERPDRAGSEMRSDAANMLPTAHAFSAVALVAQLAWEASEWAGRVTSAHTAWAACAAALPAILFLTLTLNIRDTTRWPMNVHHNAYALMAATPIAGVLMLWFFAVNVLSPGDVSPLPFLPLANPLDLTLVLALIVLWSWAARFVVVAERTLYRWAGAAVFVALNGMVLRTAHHWGHIPWRMASLIASKPLQAALTITWTVTALALMYAATKRRLRALWMIGMGLLILVLAKLFLVDLGALSGLPLVIAFLGAGILLLVIGYLSPVPPAVHGDDASAKR